MKNKLFLVLALWIFHSFGFGQNQKFEIGIEGGPSMSFIDSQTLRFDPFNPIIGFSTGVVFRYFPLNHLSIQVNPSFERKGDWEKNTRISYDYLILTCLPGFYLGKTPVFFFNAGPFLGYLLNNHITHGYTDGTDRNDFYKRVDIGLTIDLGTKFSIYNSFILSINLRNNLGLKQIVKDDISEERNWTEKTNSSILLVGLAYRFGTKKSKDY